MICQSPQRFFARFLLKSGNRCFKIRNVSEKTVIEITEKCISFFPTLDENQSEIYRKRVYKHVANRSEIYNLTSEENKQFAILSLLKDDLRACASLLYYSAHKYLTGQMYVFLNAKLKLVEAEVHFNDLDHFTSAIFYNSLKELAIEPIDLNKENYLEQFRNNKKKSVNPFLLLKYLLDSKKDLDTEKVFSSYTDLLCRNIIGTNNNYKNCTSELDAYLENFNKTPKDQRTQKDEVCASIVYCIKESYTNTERSLLYIVTAILLRLYWLRQTADYDFDFEVNTSVREMSILLTMVNLIKEYCAVNLLEKEEENNSFISKAGQYTETDTNIESGFSDYISYYNASSNFLVEEVNIDEVVIYLNSIQLDTSFDRYKILQVLNFTSNITNKGKYFIYESDDPISLNLYFNIDEDGKWTFWYSKELKLDILCTSNDLIRTFEQFFNTFIKSYEDYFEEKYNSFLVATYPEFCFEQIDSISSESIQKLEIAINSRKDHFLFKIVREINMHLEHNERHGNDYIIVGEYQIFFRLFFNVKNIADIIPIERIVNEYFEENASQKIAFVNLVINSNNLDEVISRNILGISSWFKDVQSKTGICKQIKENKAFLIEHKELIEFIDGSNKKVIFSELATLLNSISYNAINEGEYKGILDLLNTCTMFPEKWSYPLATKGLWYLRNTDIPIDESLDKGRKYYKDAIEIANHEKDEHLIDLMQKYNYEIAKFMLNRKKDYGSAFKHISDGLNLGEDKFFYNDLLSLYENNKEYLDEIEDDSILEIASARDINESKE